LLERAKVGNYYGERTMRNNFTAPLLTVMLFVLVFVLAGCDQPGKTAAEIKREHYRTLSINQQQLTRDIDRALDMDQPHNLEEIRVP
jgi:hypothetical protein